MHCFLWLIEDLVRAMEAMNAAVRKQQTSLYFIFQPVRAAVGVAALAGAGAQERVTVCLDPI